MARTVESVEPPALVTAAAGAARIQNPRKNRENHQPGDGVSNNTHCSDDGRLLVKQYDAVNCKMSHVAQQPPLRIPPEPRCQTCIMCDADNGSELCFCDGLGKW